MAFFRIPRSNFTNFSLSFSSRQNFINDSPVPNFSVFLRNPFPLFIVIFWSPRGTIDSLVLPSGHQSMYCAHRPVGLVSLFFILSFLLVLFLWKSMADYLFRNMLRSCSSRSNFWPSFFFIFFLKRAESHSAGLKVFRCYSLFYTSSFWFPEVLPTCAVRSRWVFLFFFLLGHLTLEKDVPFPLFLVFFFDFFFWTILILSWLYLHVWGIPSLLTVSEDPGSAFFFNPLTWASFLFFFLLFS